MYGTPGVFSKIKNHTHGQPIFTGIGNKQQSAWSIPAPKTNTFPLALEDV